MKYTLIKVLNREKNTQDIQFNLPYRNIGGSYNLTTWNIKASTLCTCSYCAEEIDTLRHFFRACQRTHLFWKQTLKWWYENSQLIFLIDVWKYFFAPLTKRIQ